MLCLCGFENIHHVTELDIKYAWLGNCGKMFVDNMSSVCCITNLFIQCAIHNIILL